MKDFPYYDPRTDTIHNCKPGTFNHDHELRHRTQCKQKWINKLDLYLHVYAYYIAFAFILQTIINKEPRYLILVGITWTPYTLLTIGLEIDAYWHATKKWITKKTIGKQ